MQVLKLSFKKIDNCTNNPEKSFATKIGEHITWIFHVNCMGI